MKKHYMLAFVTMCLLFTAAYYASDRYSGRHPVTEAEERESNPEETDETEAHPAKTAEATVEVILAEEPYATDSMSCRYVIQNQITGEKTVEERSVPVSLLGLKREEIIARLEKETQNSFQQQDRDTRTHYELLSFSRDEMVIQETIMANPARYECFVIAEGDFVNIYTSDRTSLYMDTVLYRSDFAEDVQDALTQGIYMRTAVELYDFLQNHTS